MLVSFALGDAKVSYVHVVYINFVKSAPNKLGYQCSRIYLKREGFHSSFFNSNMITLSIPIYRTVH